MTLNQVKRQETRKRMTAFAIGSPGAEAGGETATPRVAGGGRHLADHRLQAGDPGHGRLGAPVKSSLREFSEVFEMGNAADRPYDLIGVESYPQAGNHPARGKIWCSASG